MDDGVVPGDGERAAVDARLQAEVGRGALGLTDYEELSGAVWAATTRGELAAVTADLAPVTGTPAGTVAARRALAVMSDSTLAGPVAPGQPVHARAVMGSVVVDLRRTDLPPEVDVRAVAVMGDATVLVPRGVHVLLEGPAVLGSRAVDVQPGEPGAPVVRVHGTAVMGSVSVSHGDPTSTAVGLTRNTSVAQRRRGHSPWRRIVPVVVVAAAAYGAVQVAGADHSSVFGSQVVTVTTPGTVDVATLFGSTEVVVPDDAAVTTDGGMVFGSTGCDTACAPGRSGIAVTVHGAGAFGSVEVLTQSEQKADRDDRDD